MPSAILLERPPHPTFSTQCLHALLLPTTMANDGARSFDVSLLLSSNIKAYGSSVICVAENLRKIKKLFLTAIRYVAINSFTLEAALEKKCWNLKFVIELTLSPNL